MMRARFKGISMVLLGSLCFAQTTLPELPPMPRLPEPVTRLEADSRGQIHFSSTSPFDFKGIWVEGEAANLTTCPATLYLPEQAAPDRPVPAMVILHGSAGIREERELRYGEWLSQQGIATLVVDSFAARCVGRQTPYKIRVLAVTDVDLVADAYAALRILATHPAVDGTRIGVMGFSYGGMAVRTALDARAYQALGTGNPPFAVHVDYYGPCHFDIQTVKTTGAPYFSFRGARDESNDLVDCAGLERRLRRAGTMVGTHIYPDTGHAWELDMEQKFYSALNPASCRLVVDHLGDWVIGGERLIRPPGLTREEKFRARAGMLAQLESCLGEGYVMGRDKRVHDHSNRELLEILRTHLQAD